MRVVAKMARDSRNMVELWRRGQLFAVVHFRFFEDREEDPESTLIIRLAEGKEVHLDMKYHSEVIPTHDGSQQSLKFPQAEASKGSES